MTYSKSLLLLLCIFILSLFIYENITPLTLKLTKRRATQLELEEEEFGIWQQKYSKSYSSINEKEMRKLVFAENLEKIKRLKSSGIKYEIGLNQFSDLTFEEFSEIYLSSLQPSAFTTTTKEFQILTTNELPASVDWVSKGAVSNIKDQGTCGSCWAFSAVGALEGLHAIKTGQLISFSEQQLIDCSQAEGNKGCSGGWMDQAFDYIWDEQGIESEEEYPYTGKDDMCTADPKKAIFSITGYKYVPHNDLDQLAAAVVNQPLSVSVSVGSEWQFYKGGIYDGNCGDMVNHGVTLVGYGTENGKDYWKVKNSWGETWGEKGFIRLTKTGGIGRGKCFIADQGVYPTN